MIAISFRNPPKIESYTAPRALASMIASPSFAATSKHSKSKSDSTQATIHQQDKNSATAPQTLDSSRQDREEKPCSQQGFNGAIRDCKLENKQHTRKNTLPYYHKSMHCTQCIRPRMTEDQCGQYCVHTPAHFSQIVRIGPNSKNI